MDVLRSVGKLSDDRLLSALEAVVSRSRRATAEVVAHIGEVDARGLYRREACSSMFAYCVQRLRLSEPATAKRIQVARAARRFDGLLAYLADGRVHLSGLNLLVPHLTADNWRAVLDRAAHQSKREIERLVAELAPRPAVPTVVRKLPARAPAPTVAPVQPSSDPSPASAPCPTTVPAAERAPSSSPPPTSATAPPAPAPRTNQRAVVQPLAPARYKVQLTADQALRDKIEQAQELLRHSVPDGDLAQVFDRALTLLIDKLRAQRFGLSQAPRVRAANPEPGSRHVPAAVRRAVYERDGGRCTFVDDRGRRCTERGLVEYDHITPHACGGAATADNLRLRCRAHNQLHAEQMFGAHKMAQMRLC